MINGAQYVRRELLIRLVRAFDAGDLLTELDRIPIRMRPRGEASSRCCVYHDRAVLKYRLMALLGIGPDQEVDEAKTLREYYEEVLAKKNDEKQDDAAQYPLSVCAAGCSQCPNASVTVTASCRGCFARPCQYTCPKGAISIVDGRSHIDQSKCIKCGKCITACPYHAIMKTTVPCEDVCPVGAIRKDESGTAQIDFEKCIFCGKCFNACPFSAIIEKSQIIDVLLALKRGEKLVAMVAPAADRQFPGSIEQLFTAITKTGFSKVVEVALGAEMTTEHETAEFIERVEKDPKTLMTTSCCPAYVQLVKKHVPDFLHHVSETPSPMVFTRDIVKKEDPEAKTVFIGPCVAKRVEAKERGIDYVLGFEELGALIAGRGVDIFACEPCTLPRPAAATARGFAHSCGVTNAVLAEATSKIPGFKLDSKQIDGIDKKTASMLKLYDMGKLQANFLEVMACNGGCVNGPCSLLK